MASASKVYRHQPARQLELLVKPKLAYTSTSIRACTTQSVHRIGVLLVKAWLGAQLVVEACVASAKPTAVGKVHLYATNAGCSLTTELFSERRYQSRNTKPPELRFRAFLGDGGARTVRFERVAAS